MDGARSLSIRIIAFAAFSALCYFGASVIVTLVLAVITAYMLDPIVGALERLKFPRSLSILVVLLISALLLSGLVVLLIERTQDFSNNLPKYRSRIVKIQRDVQARIRTLQKRSRDIGSTILPPAKKEPEPVQIKEYSTWRDYIFRDLGPLYDSLLMVSFFPFLVYFLLAEKDQIRLLVSSLLRSQTSASQTFVSNITDKVVNNVNSTIRGFIFGYLISTLILFFASWLLFFAFGVELSVFWALIYSILNVLPFVGAFLGLIPPALIAVVQFASIQKGLSLIIVCIVLHLIYANWLIPRLTGPRTQLTPLISLIAMMYWGFLWGGIGILLAVPITASLKSIWFQYRSMQNQERLATAE
jgi:predicted PurR-regulated permease PerM